MPDVAPAKGLRKRDGPKPTTPVRISGPFLDIPKGSATLATTLGEADGQRYLVPFLDMSFH